jgi:hypothetical protein
MTGAIFDVSSAAAPSELSDESQGTVKGPHLQGMVWQGADRVSGGNISLASMGPHR